MQQQIKIENNIIGPQNPCFIIAEAGVNHNGDVALAKKLIDAAFEAGADAVKFQTFKAENIVTPTAEKAEYQKMRTGTSESQYEMIKKLELSEADFWDLSEYAKNAGILFLSTPFDEESVDLLDEIGVPAFKIPSGEITNFPLLKKIAQKSIPIILSTGMATLGEVEESVNYLKKYGAEEIILLHCTTSYPAPVKSVNLRAMDTLRCAFQIQVGYSDHTEGITVPIAAVAKGACVIEKHFTLDKTLPGPDHKASLDPQELTMMVKAIRDVEHALGNGIKGPNDEEKSIKTVSRRSIVAKRDLKEGDILTEEDLTIKRPGTGIEPKYVDSIVQKKTRILIRKDQVITWDMIE
ncbi:N-acetylneuraminate synthase [Methanogenium sp. S4BF]|uniref:N-acetylneuraminate synthase n=1 Tax=Methanogenium sp. S4BF TaxID=1789226 RepID=UPI002416FA88|nr:N-acetylneuraminate synthase [Methanogenium sp. S4BF]WFN35004.1 N-acetylneuraminate synthase [Methanogenium sp. S4BF]